MNSAAFRIFTFLSLCVAVAAQDSSYYEAIQKGAATQVQPNQFKKMEQDALKDYSHAETYEELATSFGNTTERVWAVIYGEVFCNLSSDADRRNGIGSLVYQLYDKSLSSKGGNLSVNLTENAQVPQGQPPFESQFELAFLTNGSHSDCKQLDTSLHAKANRDSQESTVAVDREKTAVKRADTLAASHHRCGSLRSVQLLAVSERTS